MTHPRPSLSVIMEFERQNSVADRVVSPTRTWPSLSWPREPEAPPEAVISKQQLSLRPTRAWAPATRAAMAIVLFILIWEMGNEKALDSKTPRVSNCLLCSTKSDRDPNRMKISVPHQEFKYFVCNKQGKQ